MIDQAITQIVQNAIKAPSGENAQPWCFKVSQNKIYLYNVPERDQSAYNWGQRASYIAHGAALENIEITARALGYSPRVDLFPNGNNDNLVAVVTLENSTPQHEPLYDFIEKRVTNRKPYKKERINKETLQILSAQKIPGANFLTTTNEDYIKKLAEAGASNEYIMLQNEKIHGFFFDHINWNEQEETTKRYGFYIKTLELPPPAQFMFKLFSNWKWMKVFKAIGFPKIVLHQNAAVYAQAGAIGIITIPKIDPIDCINAGKLTQRIWLTATQLGLSIQPMTGILFFMLRLVNGDGDIFSKDQQNIIEKQYSLIKNIFNQQGGNIIMMFRIGIGDAPTAQSARYHLEKVLAND